MLLGQYCVVLTQKDRLSVPSRFRHELGGKVVVTKWVEGCLMMLSSKKLTELVEKVLGSGELSLLAVRETERFLLGSAFEVELDSQGRFVLPKMLKEYAKITGEVFFIGLGDRVEIWDKVSWQKKEDELQKNAMNLMIELSNVKYNKNLSQTGSGERGL